ncbi:hypothetical protein PENTCL1PPCAC_12175 [Pristionchus entomophagus]|uniref:Secreted protein n=1 Tax=Pristionchus entomophagus TaxID=358040 RepID=A0AAV5TC67_9BILA|nr:hypothetical protein PENTCL1PPCAC_12175 [Pristionchus entomophagus]
MKISVLVATLSAIVNAQNDCNAYNELESATSCGSSGYAMNYGLPNCENFSKREDIFDARGKRFISCTRGCLARFVREELIGGNVKNCATIKSMAFASHVPCYKKCEFCQALFSNKIAFARVFRFSDFFNANALRQVADISWNCIWSG